MIPVTAEEVAAALKKGEFPDPPPHVLTEAARMIADQVASRNSTVPAAEVAAAMDTLRRKRNFDHLVLIGTAWYETRPFHARIQRLLVQGLIEENVFKQAESLLVEAATHTGELDYKSEAEDYAALPGRIRKQKFVQMSMRGEEGALQLLVDAAGIYQDRFNTKPSYFPGVNVLALRTRMSELDLEDAGPALLQFARKVLKLATDEAAAKPHDVWALASASESCLALDRLQTGKGWCDQAELWLYRFLEHSGTGPFEVESYFRQLREIWGGNPLEQSTCAGRLAGIFERYQLHRQHRWTVDAKQAQRLRSSPAALGSAMEKNFSGEKSFTVGDIRKMLSLSPNIGCVTDATGVRLGTGFLMPGAVFGKADLPLVFVTNAHVISDDVDMALSWEKARVTFEMESVTTGEQKSHAVEKVVFTKPPGTLGKVDDPPDRLDVTICILKTLPADVAGLKPARNIPLPSPKTKAFVVGHPKAGPMQFSIQDSVLLDVCARQRLMHYRTPTDPGSSGSPVFNDKWEVVALHHAGSQNCPRLVGIGTYEANEGITLQAIRREMGVTNGVREGLT